MAKTYIELTQQILQLQVQAEARRLSEAKGVIRSINEAIATYGLTAADLKFAQTVPSLDTSLATSPAASPKAQPASRLAVAQKSAGSAVVKSGGKGYSDGAGNNWTGRGPRPKWLREALAAGDSISKYEVTGHSKPVLNGATPSPVKAKSKALAPVKAKLSASPASAKAAKPDRAPTKAASALQTSTAQAHVPATAVKIVGDAAVIDVN